MCYKPGYVYVLACLDKKTNKSTGRYKIGKTVNLKERTWQLSSSRTKYGKYKNMLLFALFVRHANDIEKELHERYEKFRVYGTEWFDLKHKQLAEVLDILHNYSEKYVYIYTDAVSDYFIPSYYQNLIITDINGKVVETIEGQ